MPSHGLDQNVREIQIISSSAKFSENTKKLKPNSATPPRRSVRLKGISPDFDSTSPKGFYTRDQINLVTFSSCFLSSNSVIGVLFMLCFEFICGLIGFLIKLGLVGAYNKYMHLSLLLNQKARC